MFADTERPPNRCKGRNSGWVLRQQSEVVEDACTSIKGSFTRKQTAQQLHLDSRVYRQARHHLFSAKFPIFIVAEDDRAALGNFPSLALAARRLLSQMALNPRAAGWLIEIPPRFELLRRDPERNVTRRDCSDPEACFLAAVVDIDPSRIRRCRVCHQLFAAFRSDQRGCSKRVRTRRSGERKSPLVRKEQRAVRTNGTPSSARS
jgi:hypothetical protein